MLDYVAEELSAAPGWRQVLEAYASLTAPAVKVPSSGAPETADAIGWAPRLRRLDGVETEQLTSLHGKLIALGLLSFEVSGKTGMQYQLSPTGYRTLGQRAPVRRASSRELDELSSDDAAVAGEVDDAESTAA